MNRWAKKQLSDVGDHLVAMISLGFTFGFSYLAAMLFHRFGILTEFPTSLVMLLIVAVGAFVDLRKLRIKARGI